MKLKIIRLSKNTNCGNVAFYTDDLGEIDDCAFFYSKNFEKLFGKKKAKLSVEGMLLPVVKIQYNGRTIYRRFRYSSLIKGIDSNSIGLSNASISFLRDDQRDPVGEEAIVTKGSRFKYFWFHPLYATRATYRIGLPALVLSVLALIVSFVK